MPSSAAVSRLRRHLSTPGRPGRGPRLAGDDWTTGALAVADLDLHRTALDGPAGRVGAGRGARGAGRVDGLAHRDGEAGRVDPALRAGNRVALHIRDTALVPVRNLVVVRGLELDLGFALHEVGKRVPHGGVHDVVRHVVGVVLIVRIHQVAGHDQGRGAGDQRCGLVVVGGAGLAV